MNDDRDPLVPVIEPEPIEGVTVHADGPEGLLMSGGPDADRDRAARRAVAHLSSLIGVASMLVIDSPRERALERALASRERLPYMHHGPVHALDRFADLGESILRHERRRPTVPRDHDGAIRQAEEKRARKAAQLEAQAARGGIRRAT